jgi:septum formation protein
VADKLAAAASACRDTENVAALLVADTIVVLHDRILGKPVDTDDAIRLLGEIAGRTHTVYTRYAIARAAEPAVAIVARTVQTRVTMRSASADEIDAYARTGEGLDKAGAYAAQGIGAFLVERIEGSYSNVVGLPACEVVADFCATGLLRHFP